MPITKTVTYKVVFERLHIDAIKGTASAYFSEYIDDRKLPIEIVYNVGPDVVGPMLGTVPPDPTRTRSADIAIAVYELGIAQGWFTGTIE